MITMLSQININIILIILFSFVIFYIYNKKTYRHSIFTRFSETLAIFEKSKELAYQKTFRDHVLVQSASGFRINRDEMDKFQVIYIKLVFLFSGASIANDIEILYGDMDSICAVLANEFIQRVDQDESLIVRKLAEEEEEKQEKELSDG